jgi:hypothetical protein
MAMMTKGFRGFSLSLLSNLGYWPKLGQKRLLQHAFQFIIYLCDTVRSELLTESLNKQQINANLSNAFRIAEDAM